MTEHDANLARDHLANERTFLAWLRTAAAVMALGLAVAGLAHRVTASSAVAGCLLVVTGVTGVCYATVRYRKITRDLDNGVYTPGGLGERIDRRGERSRDRGGHRAHSDPRRPVLTGMPGRVARRRGAAALLTATQAPGLEVVVTPHRGRPQ